MRDIYIGDRISQYKVDEYGNVLSTKRNIILKPQTNKFGYKVVRIRMGTTNDSKMMFIHNLVMNSYVGQKNLDVNHIDGDKSNNHVSNLEYVDRSYNVRHAYKNGLKRMKVTLDDINYIKSSSETGVHLSKVFGVSTAMISLIKNNKVRTYGY